MNNLLNDFYVYKNSNVWAQYNYWGGGAGRNYVDGNSTLHDDYYLEENPWEGYFQPLSAENNNFELVTGLEFERIGKINEAINHYKQMFNRNIYPVFALTRLAVINNKYSNNNIQNYLETLSAGDSPYKTITLNLLAGIYLGDKMYNEAISLYNTIIKEEYNSYAAVNARFEKFFAVLNYAKDKELASQILLEIESLNLDEEEYLMRLEFAEYLLKGVSNNAKNLRKFADSGQENIGQSLPKEYALLGNYPNPFNPSTTINYALPYHSSVELFIYDIIGREIMSFNIASQSAGYQNITWDGTNENGNSVSSGIYLYRMNIKSLENNEVFVKTAKLIIMK